MMGGNGTGETMANGWAKNRRALRYWRGGPGRSDGIAAPVPSRTAWAPYVAGMASGQTIPTISQGRKAFSAILEAHP